MVQTLSPEHPAIAAAVRHDYPSFAARELAQRVGLRSDWLPLGNTFGFRHVGFPGCGADRARPLRGAGVVGGQEEWQIPETVYRVGGGPRRAIREWS